MSTNITDSGPSQPPRPIEASSSSSKQSQQQQPAASSSSSSAQPKTAAGSAEGGAANKKSGKDAKKEKRAAAVAARAAAGAGAGANGAAEGGHPSDGRLKSGADGKGGSRAQAGHDAKSTSTITKGGAAGAAAASSKAAAASSSKRATASPGPSLFSHLPSAQMPDTASRILSGRYHPLVLRYGLLIASGKIRGTNARVVGLLSAFKEVVRDFSVSSVGGSAEDWGRLLLAHLSPMISFLEECRPKGVGGGNAIRFLKGEINKVGTNEAVIEEAQQKRLVMASIDAYIRDRIQLADEVITDWAVEKIRPGSTIVTYARSSLVEKVLIGALRAMREEDENASFNVIVVDSSPLFEGRTLLKVLAASKIPTSYCLLSSLPSVMNRADLVLLGTAALLSDGSLYSRAGTALVAMLAKESRIPVVACCETYKFGEKVMLDAVTGNELGDSSLLTSSPAVNATRTDSSTLTPIHLMYDLTPAALITAVCTEVGFIPASAVPTVMVKADAEIAF